MTTPASPAHPESHPHPTCATECPPSDESFAGSLMLDVAAGLDDEAMLRERISDLVTTGEFPEVHPDEPEPTLAEAYDRLEQTIRLHDATVTEVSDDLVALTTAIHSLGQESGIVTSFSGFDAQEAANDAYAAAVEMQGDGHTVRGYLWVHQQDLQRVVLTGTLLMGFGAMSGEDADGVEIARTAVPVLRAAGLAVEWDGTAGSRIVLHPFEWSMPFRDPEE